MPKGPKSEVSSTAALMVEAIAAWVEERFGEDSDVEEATGSTTVVEGQVTNKRYSFDDLKVLPLMELRQVAKEAGCPSVKKAEILSWFQSQQNLTDESATDEDEEDETEEEETEDSEESEESDAEEELRGELEDLSPVELRNRVRATDKSKKLAELKEMNNQELIDLIVEQELPDDEDSEEEDSEEEDTEEEASEEDSGIDPDEMMDKKLWPMPKLLAFANDNGVTIPAKVVKNRRAIVDLLMEALGEDED